MRIRSIMPKFWRSDDVDRMDWGTRLLFIGLWSYVDDNGVGRDRLGDIVGDLFSGDLERDTRETFARVADGLQQLAAGGQIDRYEVDGKRYLYVCKWSEYQRVDRPNKARYPLPTCGNADREELAEPSREARDIPVLGEGEKGRRGEGEKSPQPSVEEAPKRRRATRLPEDFPVTDTMRVWASASAPNAGTRDHDDFCDYWHAKAGKDATKLDWVLTWQRWMRKASDERGGGSGVRGGPRPGPKPGPDERAAEVAAMAARIQARHDAQQIGA
jgi:hypothetical protein